MIMASVKWKWFKLYITFEFCEGKKFIDILKTYWSKKLSNLTYDDKNNSKKSLQNLEDGASLHLSIWHNNRGHPRKHKFFIHEYAILSITISSYCAWADWLCLITNSSTWMTRHFLRFVIHFLLEGDLVHSYLAHDTLKHVTLR